MTYRDYLQKTHELYANGDIAGLAKLLKDCEELWLIDYCSISDIIAQAIADIKAGR